jgi:hypothetical protein
VSACPRCFNLFAASVSDIDLTADDEQAKMAAIESKVEALMAMGFVGVAEPHVREALRLAANDENDAVDYLMGVKKGVDLSAAIVPLVEVGASTLLCIICL